MINLYSTHCPKCKIIEMKLAQKNIEHTIIDNPEEVVNVGKDHNILSAPILQVDQEFMDFGQAVKYINGRN